MKAQLWFRIGSIILFLFAAGHTYGFLTFRPTTDQGRSVWTAMQSVRLIPDAAFTYGGFYVGFGLFISASTVFLAWMAWHIASVSITLPQEAAIFGWGLAVLQMIEFGLALRYFAIPPAVMSGLSAVCFAAAAFSCRAQ